MTYFFLRFYLDFDYYGYFRYVKRCRAAPCVRHSFRYPNNASHAILSTGAAAPSQSRSLGPILKQRQRRWHKDERADDRASDNPRRAQIAHESVWLGSRG